MPKLYDEFTVRVECLDDSAEDVPEGELYEDAMEILARLVARYFFDDFSLPVRVTIRDEFEIRAKHERTER